MRTALIVVTTMVAMAAAAEERSAFGPGEQTTYKVEYLGLIAGSAQVTVGAQLTQWGKEVWPIVTIAKTESIAAVYPIRDKFVTYWDHGSQKTIGSDLYADENRKKRRQQIRLEPDEKTATVKKQKQGSEEVIEIHEVSPGTQDVAAAALALRNKELAVGTEFELPVFTGVKSFLMKATVEGKEMLQTDMGDREVFKVRVGTDFSGKLAARRDMRVYFTTDPSHVPIRMEAEFLLGHLVAELVEYKPGRDLALPSTSAKR